MPPTFFLAAINLLSMSADFTLTNLDGETALAIARRTGCLVVANALRMAGAIV